jgi:recombination protein RecA
MAKKQKMSEVEVEKAGPDEKQMVRTIRNALNKDDGEKVTWDLTKDDSPTHVKDFISTGSTLLDYIISNRRDGGVPCGKLTEIQGEEASGKSLLCAHIIANTQKKGGIAVYIDTENAANPDFMRRIGVNLEKLIYVQPGTIEKSFETIEAIIGTLRAKSASVPVTILWDSVGNTPPQAEIEGDYDPNSRMGLGAKAMAKGLRKVTELIGREKITMVFTQPLKFAMGGSPYADPFITPYGKALPYHASVRVRLTSSTKLKDKANNVYGLKTNGRIIKSRLGPGHRSVRFEIHFDHGVDDEGSWFETLHEAGLIEKRNGWCYIDMMGWAGCDPGTSEFQFFQSCRTNEKTGRREFQFREAQFGEEVRANPALRMWCLDRFDELLIVKYEDKRPVREGIEIPNEESEIVAVLPKRDESAIDELETAAV